MQSVTIMLGASRVKLFALVSMNTETNGDTSLESSRDDSDEMIQINMVSITQCEKRPSLHMRAKIDGPDQTAFTPCLQNQMILRIHGPGPA